MMSEFIMVDNVNDYCWYFSAHVQLGDPQQSYSRSGMSFQFFIRWKWYFDYRAALLKVQNPKSTIVISSGKYIRKIIDLEKNKANKIRACKGKITELKNKLERAREKYTPELFKTFDDEPVVIKFKERITRKENELQHLLEFDTTEFYNQNLKS